MKPTVALARCQNYAPENVDNAVAKAVSLIGGFERFIKPHSKVLLKPNLLTDTPPEDCVTTHPRVIESIITLLKKMDVEIFLGDSPNVLGQKTAIEKVYETSGMKDVCRRHGVTLAYFDRPVMKGAIPITDWVERCDCIINVPKFKTHSLTTLTAAIKNTFGCVLGIHKVTIHRDNLNVAEFSRRIVDVFECVKPALTIVDAVVGLEGEGPGSAGTKTDTELIVASHDAVAVDSVLAVVMGLFPDDIITTREASKRGLGESRIENIELVGDAIGEFIYSKFTLPNVSRIYKMPKLLRRLAQQLVWFRMRVIPHRCRLCKKCGDICPVKAISYTDEAASINPALCVLCSCCLEICPYKAITLQKSLALRLAGI